MQHSFLKLLGAAVLGGAIGAIILTQFEHQEPAVIAVDSTHDELPKPVVFHTSSTEQEVANEGFANLTPASEKGVQSVVHITTEFVREEITYDPFLQLFYGEDAYKIQKRKGMTSGSGVIISPEGYIVTNNHVVQDAKKITIHLDGNNYEADLIGTDPSTDLAVVKIDRKKLPYLDFSDSDNLRLGEWVLAIGNPLNLQTTITAGIVSAKNRNIDLLSGNYNPEEKVFPVESFIQTDAAVNSGNSGGALVNQNGELVGINTAIASGNGFYTGYSFAIPSNIVKKVTYDLIKYGEVKRVQLGVNIMENNSEIAKLNHLATQEGVVITGIINGGNAADAGIRTKDVILAVDQKEIDSVNKLQAELATKQPGDQIKLKVARGEQIKDISVSLK